MRSVKWRSFSVERYFAERTLKKNLSTAILANTYIKGGAKPEKRSPDRYYQYWFSSMVHTNSNGINPGTFFFYTIFYGRSGNCELMCTRSNIFIQNSRSDTTSLLGSFYISAWSFVQIVSIDRIKRKKIHHKNNDLGNRRFCRTCMMRNGTVVILISVPKK